MKTWKKRITALATGVLIFIALSLTSFGQTMNIKEFNIADGNIKCDNSDVLYHITGISNKNYITVSGGTEQAPIQVDLDDVFVDLHRENDGDSIEASPLTIKSGSYAIIYIGKDNAYADNLLYGGNDTGIGTNEGYAGISIEEGATVTIAGKGKLTAHGGGEEYGGAGIGGNSGASGSNITIQSGTIIATGAHGAAGIGGGRGGKCSNITISGGNITATGGENAAGIGSEAGDCTNITINGGKITAFGGSGGSGIGGGRDAKMENLVINNGTINAKGGENGAGIGAGGSVLEGDGGNVSGLKIYGGSIIAAGGEHGAGIGGGKGSVVSSIEIEEKSTLSINATGGTDGAGIGSADYSCGAINIKLNGGTITATGGEYAAGIGGGDNDTGSITITGHGNITAQGGVQGCGIGGGRAADVGNITITGSNVTAIGGEFGAGIGSGRGGRVDGDIYINDSIVSATGGKNAAGIGGGASGPAGRGGDEDNITITGACQITAQGGEGGAGIGGGVDGGADDISISLTDSDDFSNYVYATGGAGAAGIGSGGVTVGDTDVFPGVGNRASDITISGGYVVARGGGNKYGSGAGIGGGARKGTLHDLTITGGYTEAYAGGTDACDIGHGGADNYNIPYDDGDIYINGGTVTAGNISGEADIIISGGSVSQNIDGAKNNDGAAVYQTTFTFAGSQKTKIDTIIIDEAPSYRTHDIYSDSNNKVYLYLPESDVNAAAADVKEAGNSYHYYGTTTPLGNGILKMDGVLEFDEPGTTPVAGRDFNMTVKNAGDKSFVFSASGAASVAASAANAVTLHADKMGHYDVSAVGNASNDDPLYWSFRAEGSGNISMSESSIEITENISKTYDGTPVENPTVNTVGDGTVTYNYYKGTELLLGAPEDAGTYNVVALISASEHFAKAQSQPAEFTISPKKVTVALTAKGLGSPATFNAQILGAVEDDGYVRFEWGDSQSKDGKVFNGTASVNFEIIIGETYDVSATYYSNGNYVSDPVSETFVKNHIDREITGQLSYNKIYGDSQFNLELSTNDPTSDDTFRYEIAYDDYPDPDNAVSVEGDGRVTIKNAGQAVIKATLSDGQKQYNDAVGYITITVDRANLTVRSNIQKNGVPVTDVVYGAVNDYEYVLLFEQSDFKNGDSESNFTKGQGTLEAITPSKTLCVSSSPYQVGIGKVGADLEINGTTYRNVFMSRNYELELIPGEFSVTKAPLTVVPGDAVGEWGTEPAYSYTLNGLADWDSDVFVSDPTVFVDNYTSLEPGTYVDSIDVNVPALKQNAMNLENYNVSLEEGDLTITKASPNIKLSALSKIYNGTAAEVSCETAALYDGGNPKITYYSIENNTRTELAAAPVNAGSYAVSASVDGTELFNSQTAEQTYTILKANPDPDIPELKDIYMSNRLTLAQQVLPEGWTWYNSKMDLSSGHVRALAVYTPADTMNYRSVDRMLEFDVLKNDSGTDGGFGHSSETAYLAAERAGGIWIKGSSSGYSFTVYSPLSKFKSVQVDGITVDESNYDKREGSTVITLHADYLATLSAGQHTLQVNFTDGYAQTFFTVAEENEINPNTGYTGNTAPLAVSFFLLGCAISVRSSAEKRRKA